MAGAAGLAAGMMMGKSGGKLLGKATKYGALAALGGLAYHAWQRSRTQTTVAGSIEPTADYQPVLAEKAFVPPPRDEAARDRLGQSLVRAMIAAAKADGRIDAEENRRIFARLEATDLDPQSKAFVFDELSSPLESRCGGRRRRHARARRRDLRRLAGGDGRRYAGRESVLQMLAARLGLEPALVEEIHRAAIAEPASAS